ncbi:efflux transporter outer membrane subunit [Duganella sp. LX20W]|uniref:Efflux transporter outer membrane subunit n=1 Tax=Rugamonas brunnea TaxID=2758569 RepID=A0A7W2EVK2_9BURK|nr:efflux transporter outer membrane subunit [Rugamonas brunnea]MBA5639391.1 efflux transporter outer membrane subunit [Rugamonas brunnea]
MKKSLISLAVVALLSGCSLAPVYVRPAMPVAPHWPDGDAAPRPVALAAKPEPYALGWREFIVNEDLRKLIDVALANNRDLRISSLNIDRARAQYGLERADRIPHIDANLGQAASRVPSRLSATGDGYVARQYGAGLAITAFELDFFGRVSSLSESALQSYLGTVEARRAQQIALVAEVTNAWLTLAADQQRLQLSEAALISQQSTLALSQRRMQLGSASSLDVYEVQSSVEAARNDVAVYQAQVAADRNALALLVGRSVPPELLPQASLGTVARLAELEEGIPSSVLQRRPDVLEAERALQAANANIGAARAAFFPSISLTASAGSASSDLSGLFKTGSRTWTFSPQVNLPIFSGGANQANLEIAEVTRDISVAQYEKAVQSAFREVADALAQRGTLTERLASQTALVAASEKSYRIHEERYRQGAESYLSALVSQRAMYAAQQGLITARLDRISNQVALYKTLGGGWQ